MVSEYNFENDFVVKYFIDELKYEKLAHSLLHSDLMLIPSVVEDFIFQNNKDQCLQIIKKDFLGNRKDFFSALFEELSQHLYSCFNVAIRLNPHQYGSFGFKGHTFNIYFPFHHEKEDRNVYHIVQQPCFKIKTDDGYFIIKPDVAVFINGFLVSYLQLKMEHKGQNAKDDGRGQIIGDYIETVTRGLNHLENNKKYFHAPIHMVAMDTSSAYIIRGIDKFFADAKQLVEAKKADDSALKNEIKKSFFLDSIYYSGKSHLSLQEKSKAVLFNLYDKNRLQNEILYFNFIAYEKVSQISHGVKKVINKNNCPLLSYPRPNQKFGVEKVIDEVIQKYRHEHTDYELERFKKRLDSLNIRDDMKVDLLNKRKSYKNNQNQFSLLLQYAAGFGKTYILCWLSLMLKDLIEGDGRNALFDKILIVSDRVDLRDQVDRAMYNMNIQDKLFAEADNRENLKKFLIDGTRIIIVNIQKFPFLYDELKHGEMGALKGKRVAFLIDEIHRSNSGSQHHDMTNIFNQLVDSIGSQSAKKNLIVGLTATPTDENLARFGDFQEGLDSIKWMPFDSYTMTEAISDGFVLNPIEFFVPCSIPMKLDENHPSIQERRLPTSKEIYEHDDRIQLIAQQTAQILVNTTFKKIYGYGKGMLACYSIVAAKKYFDAIQQELKKLTQQPKYEKFKDARVFMVYSDAQDTVQAHVLCGTASEQDTITQFKKIKNGLIIVVDKLQTGFDEPKLHTLFLDKEVKEINAVQTVSRINRIAKNKEDCLLIDYSHDNVNVQNIKDAFHKFEGIVVSELDANIIKAKAEGLYQIIIKSSCYQKYFDSYKKVQKEHINKMDNAWNEHEFVKEQMENTHTQDIMKKTRSDYMEYLKTLGIADNIIGIDAKYKDKDLLLFLKDIIRLIQNHEKSDSDVEIKEVVDFWFENLGIIENGVLLMDKTKNNVVSEVENSELFQGEKLYDVISAIRRLNQQQQQKEILIEDYINKLHKLFDKMIELDKKNESKLILRVKNPHLYPEKEISKELKIVYEKANRRLKNTQELMSFLQEIDAHVSLLEDDFITYVNKEKNS